MIIKENVLHKILDYENIDICSILKKISEILNIQFFQDNEIFTLGNEYFIIDINNDLHITFVEETLYDIYRYLLKFFILYFSKIKTKNEVKNVKSGFCECISSYNYCDLSNFISTKNNLIFNIFTHRYESFEFKPYFFSKPEYIALDNFNLGECLDYEMIDRMYFLNFQKCYCYVEIHGVNIFVDNKLKIYINNKYDENLSFLFKYGLSLKDCILRINANLF
ncbi:hypothetical protein NAPIS_ORF00751 [Vairimorpha apis BRL 01]|uniref:Uncharacterized protein n=1 Tax=Vairimorpha apis BRL 01 TaxID=1037528 RepID=T0LBM2_9MICR|nr:hypothetical protein NAPIS_ORF00751 [Vairimorpha apis BRL 01]